MQLEDRTREVIIGETEDLINELDKDIKNNNRVGAYISYLNLKTMMRCIENKGIDYNLDKCGEVIGNYKKAFGEESSENKGYFD